MRQEECIGPGGFTRTKEARGEEAGVVSKEAAGNGRQEAVGATGISSWTVFASASTPSMPSLRTRSKVGVADVVLSSSCASTPTLTRSAMAAKEPMQAVVVGAPELTLATGYA